MFPHFSSLHLLRQLGQTKIKEVFITVAKLSSSWLVQPSSGKLILALILVISTHPVRVVRGTRDGGITGVAEVVNSGHSFYILILFGKYWLVAIVLRNIILYQSIECNKC